MIIPNDTGHPWRLYKFVEYQHKVPPIGPATYIAYAKKYNLDEDDCIMLAWYNSMSYCEVTAIYLLRELDWKRMKLRDVQEFWNYNRDKLLFVSARRYVKNMDWFVPLMDTFMREIKREPMKWLKNIAHTNGDFRLPKLRYKNVYNHLMKWKYMGRFSVELFMDALVQFSREGLISIRFEGEDFDWRKGSNITSGMLNMFYCDKVADIYDKTGKIDDETVELLGELIEQVQAAIKEKYPSQDTSIGVITPKMCSWRNLFKGRRYGGYHHDRQLEQLKHYKKEDWHNSLWDELFDLREEIFDPVLLGEIGGWKGIRKERNKLWLERGLTGVETSSEY